MWHLNSPNASVQTNTWLIMVYWIIWKGLFTCVIAHSGSFLTWPGCSNPFPLLIPGSRSGWTRASFKGKVHSTFPVKRSHGENLLRQQIPRRLDRIRARCCNYSTLYVCQNVQRCIPLYVYVCLVWFFLNMHSCWDLHIRCRFVNTQWACVSMHTWLITSLAERFVTQQGRAW